MKAIQKGNEPHSLTQHRLATHADYDNYYSNFAQKSGDTKGVPSPLTIEVADKASRLTDTRNA